ncbi:hypothetical protein SLA2020_013730 [Shorea laevis]
MAFAARDCWGCYFEEELPMSPELVSVSSSKAGSDWRSLLLMRSALPQMMGQSKGLGVGGVSERRKTKLVPS